MNRSISHLSFLVRIGEVDCSDIGWPIGSPHPDVQGEERASTEMRGTWWYRDIHVRTAHCSVCSGAHRAEENDRDRQRKNSTRWCRKQTAPIPAFSYEWDQLLVAVQHTSSNLICLKQSFHYAQRRGQSGIQRRDAGMVCRYHIVCGLSREHWQSQEWLSSKGWKHVREPLLTVLVVYISKWLWT